MTAMIISYERHAAGRAGVHSNRSLLLEQPWTSIQPTARGTDLNGALELARGLANPGR